MTTIRLETSIGDYVDTVTIPKFKTAPQVVIWGERVFRLVRPDVYREVFAYYIPVVRA